MIQPSPQRITARLLEASAEVLEVGDIIEALTKRGWKQGTIASVEWKPRSAYPYLIRYVTDDGQDFHGKRKSNRYDDPDNKRVMKFIGKNRKKKLIEESLKREDDINQRKRDRADAGAASLESWEIQKGDVILYRYNNATREEVVAGVNYSTGKVGIERFKNENDKELYLLRLRDRRERKEMLEEFYGMSARGTRDTSVRWLPGTGIVKVVQKITQ